MTPECEFQPSCDLQGFDRFKYEFSCGMKGFALYSENFRHRRSQRRKETCEQNRVSVVLEGLLTMYLTTNIWFQSGNNLWSHVTPKNVSLS